MTRAVLLGTLLVAFGLAATSQASEPIVLPTGQEGCVSPPGDTCTFTSTRDGGYVANGSGWTLTVAIPAAGDPRDTNGDGQLRYVFTSANAPDQGCGMYGPGSTITTSSGGDGGLAAGNPIPGAADPAIGTANDCATGKVAANNPNYTPTD